MKDWIPVPGSAKGRLALLALQEFARNGYEDVNVVDLAARAGVTTGSLYHHFGSKGGLYAFVRTEIEQRVLDRMQGAAAALTGDGPAAVVRAAVLIGFDAALEQGAARMLSEPPQGADRVADLVARASRDEVGARITVAAWRAALAVASGRTGRARAQARAALAALLPERDARRAR